MKDYSVLLPCGESTMIVIHDAFDKGYKQGYEDGKADTPFTDTEEAEKKAYNRGLNEALEQTTWIPVSEKLPETDYENTINNCNVLLWVKNKTHPEREPQIYLGKLRHVDGDDGSGNFWGIETKPCDWTIWGWCYLNEPEVIAWMPLPPSYQGE